MSKPTNQQSITVETLLHVTDFGCMLLRELGQPRLAELYRLQARREVQSSADFTNVPAMIRETILDIHRDLMNRTGPSDN